MEDWWEVHRDRTTATLAVRRLDVSALNDMVRAWRQAAGELEEEIRFGGGKTFGVGDPVIFEKNQRVKVASEFDQNRGHGMVRIQNSTFGTVVVGDSAQPCDQGG
jgi:ATP-dependent exoDNAse (exonuclease V) alpha subunit